MATESPAYSLLRQLMKGAGLTLHGLEAQLEQAGFACSAHTIASWGRRERGFPNKPALLIVMARILISHHLRRRPCPPDRVLAFLAAAGVPPAAWDALADLFSPAAFASAYAAHRLRSTAGSPLALPADSAPDALPLGSRPPPFNPNPLFRGRSMLIGSIARTLAGPAALALTGLGGVGKTQLVGELAFRYGRFFAGGVFWLNASDPLTLDEELAACGGAQGMALHPNFDDLPLAARVAQVRAAWAKPLPRLVILDNVDTRDTVVGLLPPPGSGCRLLLTTQLADWPAREGIGSLTVGPLERGESMALLRCYLGREVDDRLLIALAEEAGDLPLALHLIGSALAQDDAVMLAPRLTPTGHDPSIARTLALAIGRLDPAHPDDQVARLQLIAAACLAPGEAIPRELLLALPSDLPEPWAVEVDEALTAEMFTPAARRGLQRLLSSGLVERAQGDTLRIHRLVARQALALPEREVARARIEHVMRADARRWDILPPRLRLLLPHLRTLAGPAAQRADRTAALLLSDLGWSLTQVGIYAEAQERQRGAYELLLALQGSDHDETAECLCRLALAHEYAGDNQAAFVRWQELLFIERRRLPPQSPQLGLSLCNIGYFLLVYGDLDQSEALLRESLAIRRATRPLLHWDTARSLRNLGGLEVAHGRYRRGQRYLRLACAIFEQLGAGQEHPLTLTYMMLGDAAEGLGDFGEARRCYERSLEICALLFGGGDDFTTILHDYVAIPLRGLGRLALEERDLAQARRLLEAALHAVETVSGPAHEIAQVRIDLAELERREGRYAAAEEQLAQALPALRATLAPTNLQIARALLALARLRLDQGEHAAVSTLLEEALVIVGEAHPLAAPVLACHGDFLALAGDPAGATYRYAAARDILIRTTPHHPHIAVYRERAGEVTG